MNHALRSSTLTHLALVAAGFGTTACGGAMAPSTDSSSGGATAISSGGATVDASGGATAVASGGATVVASGGATATMGTCPTQEFRAAHFLCGVTVAGIPIVKGAACTATDPQFCYKGCGPIGLGFKSETCTDGVYVENSSCLFDPACDYSCFRLPATPNPACPEVAPQGATECSLPPCIVCGGTASLQTTGYLTTDGIAKVGYCVCRPAIVDAYGFVTSPSKWSCATMGAAWPCPGNPGC